MGMYDTIICEYPLPMPNDPKGYSGSKDFQTKDLDSALDLYEIDKNGQLFLQRSEGEWVEGDKNATTFSGKMGYFKTTKRWKEELALTATINFYDYQHSQNTNYDYFIEYKAVFIDGKISSVEIIDFEARDNAERKKKDLEFDKKLKDWYEFTKTRRYKYILRPYASFIRFVFRNIRNFLTFLQSKLYFVEKFFLIK
jgi:hypothetical protein